MIFSNGLGLNLVILITDRHFPFPSLILKKKNIEGWYGLGLETRVHYRNWLSGRPWIFLYGTYTVSSFSLWFLMGYTLSMGSVFPVPRHRRSVFPGLRTNKDDFGSTTRESVSRSNQNSGRSTGGKGTVDTNGRSCCSNFTPSYVSSNNVSTLPAYDILGFYSHARGESPGWSG